MNKSAKPLGRPTFRLDGARLRELRKEAGLTQLQLAERVYGRAGKRGASQDVMKNSAQRWESSGRVPHDIALHLAAELKTTVAVLQGALPEPAPSRVDEIESHLKRLLDSGPPTRQLAEALEFCKESDNPIREVAAAVASRIEMAQLSQAQEEFEDLAAITRYSISELQKPGTFDGLWMLMRPGTFGMVTAEILTGVALVLHTIRTELQTCVKEWQGSDARVIFVENRNWFEVRILHPHIPAFSQSLRFVRCQPIENGLQWSSPTWRDRYWLTRFTKEVYGYANFVAGFDAVRVPSDCNNLRLAVKRFPSPPEKLEDWNPDADAEVVLLTSGDFNDMPSERFESWKRAGFGHDYVVNRWASDLWEKMLPLLSDWPLECWSFRRVQAGIHVHLQVPYRLYAASKAPLHFGLQMSVELVETLADGCLTRAPWSEKSVEKVHELLSRSLAAARQAKATSSQQSPAA